jgi:mitochondrial fission protein ELM1
MIDISKNFLQIQLPRMRIQQYDMVITPHHDYHALTPAAQQEVPEFLLRWISPWHPPDKHVVSWEGA